MPRLPRLGSGGRLRAALLTGGIAVAVLVVAFLGGFLSGKAQHQTTFHGTGSLPPVASSTTTSTIPPAAIAAVKAQLVDDMGLDVDSQRLDADVARRAALAETPAAIAARHEAITTAWAADKAPGIQANYDRVVLANAHNPKSPSVLHAAFVVVSWGEVYISGTTATVSLRGHYQLTEPATVVNLIDQTWTITLQLDAGRWRLETRSAA